MSLKSIKIFPCFIICLTICKCIESQHCELMDMYRNIPDYSPNSDSFVKDNVNNNSQVDTKIVKGHATLGQFPYMAVVHQLYSNQLVGPCGGTIIAKRWVLTAAHCVINFPRRFLVVFGIVDKSGVEYDTVREPGVSMITTQVFIYEDYVEADSYNDIALLYMPEDIPFSSTIQPIQLPADDNKTFINRQAYIVGWGRENKANRESTILKYGLSRVIYNRSCRYYFVDVTLRHICMEQGTGQGACQSDSGGPLVVIENGKHLQIGIVIYGDTFCPPIGFPGVFTRVSSYVKWINETSSSIV